MRPSKPKPTTRKPVIAPDLNEISKALSILSVAACVVLTLALTETNIPTYPASPERKAPITKPIETKGLCIR